MARLSGYYGPILIFVGRVAAENPESVPAETADRFRTLATAASERASRAGVANELRQRADRLVQQWYEAIVTPAVMQTAATTPLGIELQRLAAAPYRPEDDDIRELALLLLEFGLAARAGGEMEKARLALRDSLSTRIVSFDKEPGTQLTPDAYKALGQLPARAPVRAAAAAGGTKWMPIAAGVGAVLVAGVVAWWLLGTGAPTGRPGPQQASAPKAPPPAAQPATPPPPAAPAPQAAAPATPAPALPVPPAAPPPAATTPAAPTAPVTEPPKPPQQVAALTPGAVDAVLKEFKCAELDWASDGKGGLLLRGHVASADDKKSVVATAGKLPGVSSVADDLVVLPPPLCTVIDALEPARDNSVQRGLALDVRIDDQAALTKGKPLAMEVTSPSFSAAIQVDYFQPDGKVLHLIPNNLDQKNRVPPRSSYTVGKAPSTFKNWTIGDPVGDHVVLVIATREPLFDTPRPESEDAVAYLTEVSAKVKEALQKDPSAVAAVTRAIVTKPGS